MIFSLTHTDHNFLLTRVRFSYFLVKVRVLCVCSPEQALHTYASAGVYFVSISEHLSGFGFGQPRGDGYFDKGQDCDKLDIVQWGCSASETEGDTSTIAKNLGVLSARDVPDLTGVTNLSQMFYNASVFTGDLSAWNVRNAQTRELPANLSTDGKCLMSEKSTNLPVMSGDSFLY